MPPEVLGSLHRLQQAGHSMHEQMAGCAVRLASHLAAPLGAPLPTARAELVELVVAIIIAQMARAAEVLAGILALAASAEKQSPTWRLLQRLALVVAVAVVASAGASEKVAVAVVLAFTGKALTAAQRLTATYPDTKERVAAGVCRPIPQPPAALAAPTVGVLAALLHEQLVLLVVLVLEAQCVSFGPATLAASLQLALVHPNL